MENIIAKSPTTNSLNPPPQIRYSVWIDHKPFARWQPLSVLQQHPWVIFAHRIQRNFFPRLDVKIGAWIPALLRKGPACSQADCCRLAMLPPWIGEGCVPRYPTLPPPRRLQLAHVPATSQALQTEYKGKVGVLDYLHAALASVDATSLFLARLWNSHASGLFWGESARCLRHYGGGVRNMRCLTSETPRLGSAWEGPWKISHPPNPSISGRLYPDPPFWGRGLWTRPQPEKKDLFPVALWQPRPAIYFISSTCAVSAKPDRNRPRGPFHPGGTGLLLQFSPWC